MSGWWCGCTGPLSARPGWRPSSTPGSSWMPPGGRPRRWWWPRMAPGGPAQRGGVAGGVVHGDCWDDKVFFQGETLVFVADFAFMAERARIDDLALTLYYADTEAGLTTSPDRIAALRPLVHGYASGLGNPLTDAEHQALPWAIARQPLWAIGGCGPVLHFTHTPSAHALPPSPSIGRAPQLGADSRA